MVVVLAACAPQALAAETDPYIVVLEDSAQHPEVVARRHEANRGARIGSIYHTLLKGYAGWLEPAEADAVARDPMVAYVERDHWGRGMAQSTPTSVKRVFASTNFSLDIDETDDLRVDADVAVLDTGLDTKHEDLYVTSLVDCTGIKCEEGKGADKHGHGTGVAGMIGAIDNKIGITGVAPGVRLWSVKVLNDNNEGLLSKYILGIEWVTAHAEQIEVANGSVGYNVKESTSLATALAKSVEAGVVHVVAAGNQKSNANKFVPANETDVISVSAIADYDGLPEEKAAALWEPQCTLEKMKETDELVGADDTTWTYSNFGTVVDIAAPGVCVLTTEVGNTYALESGTSIAAPLVSGGAAILASLSNPNTRKAVEEIRSTMVWEGNTTGWKDTSGDGAQEPLLDLSNEEVFKLE
jgi:subtilisin